MTKFLIGIALVCVMASSNVTGENNKIPYPVDYKSSFTNYISSDRLMNPDQTIRMFANDVAMQGPGEDGKLPYGSVLVAEVYKAKKDEEGIVLTSNLNRRIKEKFALIAVMKREEGFADNLPDGLKNDGWDFAAFKPDGSVAENDLNECRSCHAPLTETNHLFSYEHLIK